MNFKNFNIFIIFINYFALTSSSKDCSWDHVENCLKSFKPYLENSTIILRDFTEEQRVNVCWIYMYASNCLTNLMFTCPDVKTKLHAKFETWEYACNTDPDDDPQHWPIMPTIDPRELEFLRDKERKEEHEKFVDNLVKASIAAGITLAMVSACFAASMISRYRIKRKIDKQRKSRAPIEIKVLDDQEKLIRSLIGADDNKGKGESTYQSADK